jgi:hypothetical protein
MIFYLLFMVSLMDICLFNKFIILTSQCILSNSIFCILSRNITYSYASGSAPVWPEYIPEGPKNVAIEY